MNVSRPFRTRHAVVRVLAMVASVALASMAMAQEAGDDGGSEPFYERPWNHVAYQGKLYFNTQRGDERTRGGLFEYDPTSRPGHPRGRVRAVTYLTPSLGSTHVAWDGIHFAQRELDPDGMYVWSGFDRPLRRIPWSLHQDWELGEVNGGWCIVGMRSASGEPVFRTPRCMTLSELLGDRAMAQPVPIGQRLYFFRNEPALWTTDGTPGGARRVQAFPDSSIQQFMLDHTLLFSVKPRSSGAPSLWRIDAEHPAPQLVANVEVNEYGGVAQLGGALYFRGVDAAHGSELWRSDGTAEGTRLVADIAPGPIDSKPSDLTVVGDTLYFAAYGPQGTELWRSDGTPDGTRIVRDIHRRGGSFPNDLTVVGERLYFVANDGLTGRDLYTTDGTEAGTRGFNLTPAPLADTYPWAMTAVEDALYFWAADGTWPYMLWRLDAGGLASVLSYNQPKPLRIDGAIDDWGGYGEPTPMTDAVGDVGPGDPIDWIGAAATASGDVAFLRYRTAAPVDASLHAARFQAFFDVDRRPDTGYRSDDPAFTIGAEYVLQGNALLRYMGSGRDWAWEPVATAQVAASGQNIELSLDTTHLPGPRIIGSWLLIRADNPGVDDYVRPW